ncbi:MAG: polysaccharide deacetylase family protein [Candidatus Marinimicrobia bacterium]|nr:polysaccharide deacetylase family protein [Candidatus Neomarinimicrobiota bacterium]
MFSAHDRAEGAELIADTLQHLNVPASFFFTGDFYRNKAFGKLIRRLLKDGHYLGAHSDRHLLYNKWDEARTLNVSKDSFKTDLRSNYDAMSEFGIKKEDARYFLPPYEWYDEHIALWTYQEGLTLVNFTGGTLTQADYTTPGMGDRYRSNAEIWRSVMEKEAEEGLSGNILLIHPGTEAERSEKFYHLLDELIKELRNRGYRFVRIDEMLNLPYNAL